MNKPIERMDLFISIVTGGKHNPTLSVKLDNETATVFALEFINLFGDLVKTENGIEAQGRTYQQKTPELMDELRTFIQGYGGRKELWDFYNVLAELKDGEYFALVTRALNDKEYDAIKENVLRLNMPDYEALEQFKKAVCGELLENYKLIHYEQERRQVRIGEPEKGMRKCRFCGKMMPVVSYEKDAHTISEGLGNKSIITNDECDKCNEDLGREIEQDLMTYLSPMRTFMSLRGKKGLVKIKDDSFALYEDAPGQIHIDLFEQDEPELKHWEFEQNGDDFKWTFTHPQMLNPQDVYRAVVKYVIGVMENAELSHFKETITWVRKMRTATDLPRLCFYLDNNPKSEEKPCITVFLRMNDDKSLPYCFVELQVSGVVIFGIIPLCDQDDRTYSKEEDWNHFIDVAKIFKQMPVLKVLVPNDDTPIRMTYEFVIKKREIENGRE